MNIFCPEPCVECKPIPLGGAGIFPDPNAEANPFANLSSEAPDGDFKFRRNYRIPGDPPLGSDWRATGCIGLCMSFISQEDADLCAARQTVLCTSPDWPLIIPGTDPDDPDTPAPRPVFSSNSQLCEFRCADGSFFKFIIVAGLFNAFSQAEADAMAYSYACQKALANVLCFGSLSRTAGCVGEPFTASVGVISIGGRPVTFEILGGDIPPGLSPAQSNPVTQIFTGTPTTAGTYSFTLQARDSLGNAMFKRLTIGITGIANSSPLPEASEDEAYSVTLMGLGTTDNARWSVTGGALPPGLALNDKTGEISGTPTVPGTYIFDATLTTP